MRFRNTTEIVRPILENDERARNSDDYLYYKVVKQIQKQTSPVTPSLMFDTLMLHREEMGIPSYETVGRVRRKLQEKNPELRACPTVEAYRKENEAVFRAYALGDGSDG